MKKYLSVLIFIGALMGLTSCGPATSENGSIVPETTVSATTTASTTEAATTAESSTSTTTKATTTTVAATHSVTTTANHSNYGGITNTHDEQGVGKSFFTKELMEDINTSGEFTMDMECSGDMYSGSVYLTSDGDNTYYEASFNDFTLRQLTTSDGAYLLDSADKRYFRIGDDSPFITNDITDAFIDMDLEYTGTVGSQFNGIYYYCETFSSGARYYYDTESFEMKAIESGEAKAVVNKFTAEADSSKFKIPSDYTEMSEEDFSEWSESVKSIV